MIIVFSGSTFLSRSESIDYENSLFLINAFSSIEGYTTSGLYSLPFILLMSGKLSKNTFYVNLEFTTIVFAIPVVTSSIKSKKNLYALFKHDLLSVESNLSG